MYITGISFQQLKNSELLQPRQKNVNQELFLAAREFGGTMEGAPCTDKYLSIKKKK